MWCVVLLLRSMLPIVLKMEGRGLGIRPLPATALLASGGQGSGNGTSEFPLVQ